jgi:hypothetical protein
MPGVSATIVRDRFCDYDVSGDTCRDYADGAVPLASSVDCQPRYGNAGGATERKEFGRLGTRLCELTWGEA